MKTQDTTDHCLVQVDTGDECHVSATPSHLVRLYMPPGASVGAHHSFDGQVWKLFVMDPKEELCGSGTLLQCRHCASGVR